MIIHNITTRTRKTSHKYGIEVPENAKHAHDIDRKNRKDFWRKEIEKEMHAVGVAFEILAKKDKANCGWSKVTVT